MGLLPYVQGEVISDFGIVNVNIYNISLIFGVKFANIIKIKAKNGSLH